MKNLIQLIENIPTSFPRRRYTFEYPDAPGWWAAGRCTEIREENSRWQVRVLPPDHPLLRGPASQMLAYTAKYFTHLAYPFQGYEEYTVYVADGPEAPFALAHELGHILAPANIGSYEEELAADQFARWLYGELGLPVPTELGDFDPTTRPNYLLAYGRGKKVSRRAVRQAFEAMKAEYLRLRNRA